jgi:hypothetical protein
MRRALWISALIVATLSSAACQALPFLAPQACPLALLEGTLVAAEEDLQVAAEAGPTYVVHWPQGTEVRRTDKGLALVGFLGIPIAREGDWVSMGGGYAPGDEFFTPCGDIQVSEAPS